MKYIKSFALFEKAVEPSADQDPDLVDFRFYRGSALQFKEYWDRKAGLEPTRKISYQYPVTHEVDDKSLPYQDFANGESSVVKSNMETRRRRKEGSK